MLLCCITRSSSREKPTHAQEVAVACLGPMQEMGMNVKHPATVTRL